MKKSAIVAFIILLVVVGWFFSGQLNSKKENLKKEPEKSEFNNNIIKVESAILIAEDINQSIRLQGQTKHNRKIEIKSETTGNIIKKNYKRGQLIESKEILLEISIEDRLELLNSHKKDFERIKKELSINEKKRDNLIFKTKEQIKLFEIEFNSVKKLVDKGLSSKSKLNLASFNLAEANSNLKDIELNYQSQLTNLESQLANIKSKIKNIEKDINNTKISPPFSGIINNSYVEIGDYVQPGNILLSVVDLNPIKIQGFISESQINKIQIGKKAKVISSNSITKIGEITFISPSAETSTRTFEIIIEADNNDLLFKSGITTTIEILGDSIKAHKISPSILTLLDDGTVGVKAINQKNLVVFYPIKKEIDTIDGMWVTGLPEKVKIITSGQEYITVGQSVDIK